MNILIINGSPKGEASITLKTAQYLEKLHPEHHFEVLQAARTIRGLEKDFSPAQEAIQRADMIIFTYPVYTFLAPSQLHRFFELLVENNVRLDGKYGTQITTSKHFYDTTAHAFVDENMRDLGLTTFPGLSADMADLLAETGQKQARDFFRQLIFRIERGMGSPPTAEEAPAPPAPYVSSLPAVPKKNTYKVALVHVGDEKDPNLAAMIRDFEQVFPYETVHADIGTFPFQGGCLGCLRCAQDGTCIYKDGFEEFLRGTIQSCDGIVYAFPIRQHFTDARLKMFDDRQFCNGHRTVTEGTPVGYLLSGDLQKEANLQHLLEARASVGGNYLAGMATDQGDAQKQVADLAATMAFALENNLSEPKNFLGVGGSKIFRDLVYGMQGFMRADHQFFKEHNMYDFPQKDKKTLWGMRLVGTLMRIPKLQKEIQQQMDAQMLRPYEDVLAGVENGTAADGIPSRQKVLK